LARFAVRGETAEITQPPAPAQEVQQRRTPPLTQDFRAEDIIRRRII
jgi:hypothetical protein